MVFVMALPADFESAGIPITTERIIDSKAIKHVEHLSAEQFEAIRFNEQFEFVDEIPIQEGD